MALFYIILFLCGILNQIIPVSLQPNYIIGVQSSFYPLALQGINLPSNVQVINVTVNDASNITALTAETQRLNTLGIDYLIYLYNQNASLVTNAIYSTYNKLVPYLILPVIGNDPILGTNAFYTPSEGTMAMDATRGLLNYFNISTIVYIDYAGPSTANNLFAFKSYSQTLVTISNNTQIPTFLNNIFQSNIQSTYICAIPINQSALITSILTEAMFMGQLNPGKLWIFNKVTNNISNFNIFQQYSQVGANIYSFGVNYATNVSISSLSDLQQSITRDYIRFILTSINNSTSKPPNASLQLINSLLPSGELLTNAAINTSTNQINGITLNVMKVNMRQIPLQKFIYNGQFSEVNSSSIERSLNYSTVTVRIGVILSKAYFMQNSNNAYYGFSVSVLNALRKLSNFQFVYVFPNDSLTGEVPTGSDTNKTYNGIISLINQSLVDMSIIPMNPQNFAGDVFQSDILMLTKISMLTREPNETIFYILIFVPFAYNVWFGIALIILIMTIGFYSINKISPNHSKKNLKKKFESYSFLYSFLIIYSSFVTAKLKIKPTQPSLHIFAFILWFSTLTFVITYACNMIAHMIVPTPVYPFQYASSLNQNSTFKWSFVNNSIDVSIAQNDIVLSRLYNTAMQNWNSEALINDSISETILLKNKYVLIQDDNKNRYIFNRYCNSDKLQGTNNSYNLIFPMSKTWPQRFEMKSLISQMINNGTIISISNLYFNLGKCARNQDGVTPLPKQLTLLATISLFLIPLAGIVLGLLGVIVVLLKEKIQRCLKNSKLSKFVYGQLYDANVSSVENDGVWAFINGRDRPYFVSCTSLHPDLRKTYTPQELNIKAEDIIKLKYFGKDPVNGYKRFCKDMEE